MNKLPRGIQESIYGIIAGIIIATMMKALVEDGLLPSYFVWIFILVGIIGNIVTIKSLRLTGTVYTIGWLIGGLILKDILDPIDFIIYIVIPIIILVLRTWQFIQYLRNN